MAPGVVDGETSISQPGENGSKPWSALLFVGSVPAGVPGVRDHLDLLPAEVATPLILDERQTAGVDQLVHSGSGDAQDLGRLPVGGEPGLPGGVPLQGEELHVGQVQAVPLPLHGLGQNTPGYPPVHAVGPHAEDARGLGGAEPLARPGRVLVHDRQRKTVDEWAPSRTHTLWMTSGAACSSADPCQQLAFNWRSRVAYSQLVPSPSRSRWAA